jgi:hypothetical protein
MDAYETRRYLCWNNCFQNVLHGFHGFGRVSGALPLFAPLARNGGIRLVESWLIQVRFASKS